MREDEAILSWKAGPCMDALVAHVVFGADVVNLHLGMGEGFRPLYYDKAENEYIWEYSTDLNAAWRVADLLNIEVTPVACPAGKYWQATVKHPVTVDGWQVDYRNREFADADKPALAICLAALASKLKGCNGYIDGRDNCRDTA